MNIYYLDISALVKRYVDETGSVWLRALIDPALRPLVTLSYLAVAEMTSAFRRRAREGLSATADYARVQAAFRGDCLNEFHLVPINAPVIDLAGQLIERHPLRTLDALHLATGLTIQSFFATNGLPSLTFASADDRLLVVASAEGLATQNPVHHL